MPDAHRCSFAAVESHMPYVPSGYNARSVVPDAHRCSFVVVESHVPYFPSDRNALCSEINWRPLLSRVALKLLGPGNRVLDPKTPVRTIIVKTRQFRECCGQSRAAKIYDINLHSSPTTHGFSLSVLTRYKSYNLTQHIMLRSVDNEKALEFLNTCNIAKHILSPCTPSA